MAYANIIAARAKVIISPYRPVGSTAAVLGIYLTPALQLIGAYRSFKGFAQNQSGYKGWEAHHIFEGSEASSSGGRYPIYDEQLCVLLPNYSHRSIVSPHLSSWRHLLLTRREIIDKYRDVYEDIGEYCGGSQKDITRELVALLTAILAHGNVA